MHPDVIKMCERDKDPTPVLRSRGVFIPAEIVTNGCCMPVLVIGNGNVGICGEENLKRFAEFLIGRGWISYDKMENEGSYTFDDRGAKTIVKAEINHYDSNGSDPMLSIYRHGYRWSSSDGVAIGLFIDFVVKYFGPEKSE